MPEPDFSEPRKVCVAVLGAGALGSLYGASFHQAGCRVSLITRRREHREAINKNGLQIIGPGGGNSPQGGEVVTGLKAYPDLQSAPQPDLLILLVKSHETQRSMEQSAPFIPGHCLVLTLQNGIGNLEAICKYVPQARALAGVSYRGATYAGPGCVRHSGKAETIIGSPLNLPHCETVRALFERVGLPCSVSKNIQGLIWTKLMVNIALNPLAALTRQTNGTLGLDGPSVSLMASLLEEAMTVAAAKGIRLETEQPLEHVLKIAAATAGNKASMLQDILAGRKTEINSMNGAIVEEGKSLGLPTPVNAIIAGLVSLLEKSPRL